jgi:Ca2+-binding RTX toxin-like protein
MKTRGALVTLLVAASVLATGSAAQAAACSSTVLDGTALIVGTGAGEDIWVHVNGADIECRIGNVGAFTAVGTKAAISDIFINANNGDDDVHIGDSTNGAQLFTAETININFGSGNVDVLHVDGSSSSANESTDFFDGYLSFAFGIYFSNATDVELFTGSGDDTSYIHTPLTDRVLMGNGSGTNKAYVFGDDGGETFELTHEITANRVTRDGVFEMDFLPSVQTVQVGGGDGNDTIHAAEPWVGIDLIASGGNGNDRLTGSDNDDILFGGAGRDRLFGGAGADQLDGEANRDACRGGPGPDTFKHCEARRQN